MTVAERAQAEARLGLDQPISVQYIRWLENALRGDFGISYKYKRPQWYRPRCWEASGAGRQILI